jgi:hypothetical protein
MNVQSEDILIHEWKKYFIAIFHKKILNDQ